MFEFKSYNYNLTHGTFNTTGLMKLQFNKYSYYLSVLTCYILKKEQKFA